MIIIIYNVYNWLPVEIHKKEDLRFKKLIYFPQYKKNKLDFIKILGKAKTL